MMPAAAITAVMARTTLVMSQASRACYQESTGKLCLLQSSLPTAANEKRGEDPE
jgi:hypothetical protein